MSEKFSECFRADKTRKKSYRSAARGHQQVPGLLALGTALGNSAQEIASVVARRGREALAWEVLRRDPAYQAAFGRLKERMPIIQVDNAFVTRWGLHFP